MTVKAVDPGERLDWAFNWATSWLPDGDSISSYSWAIYDGPDEASGITLVNDTSESVTVPKNGMTLNYVYKLVTAIVTANGLESQRTITIRCVER